MSEDPKSADFPTADTVPFPFESPYNVQRELMAALLDSLRQCRDTQQLRVDKYDCIDTAAAIDKPKSRRAPIIMLESPTGTGKSLSLACASMAWLKYCERDDIDKLLPPNATNDKPSATTVGSTNDASDAKDDATASSFDTGYKHNKRKKYDWIEAWQPADQHSSFATPVASSSFSPLVLSDCSRNSIYDQVRSFAIENRTALEIELAKLRARLDRLNCVSSSESANLHHDRKEKERMIRENLVRSGVASALVNERKHHRRLARYKGDNPGQTKKRRKIVSNDDDQFLLETYHSDDEAQGKDNSIDSDEDDDIALRSIVEDRVGTPILSSKALLEGRNLDGSGYQYDPEKNARVNKSWEKSTSNELAVGGVKAGTGLRKIVYAARTHSQLSQFIGELKRTYWRNDVKVVALGSRTLLCSNEHVLYSSKSNKMQIRRGEAEITEMCLDMQKSKTAPESNHQGAENATRTSRKSSCPYMSSSEAISTLALHSLVRPSDVEDMARLGKASGSCSYFASRHALAAAEVVVVPYNILLSPQARHSVGLSIKNSLVIIDEAHNIPETLRSISTCQLSLSVAERALAQLLAYTKKYSGRLAGRNVFYLGQIRRILSAMIKYLKHPPFSGIHGSEVHADNSFPHKTMMAAVDLMFTLKLDNINLFTILRYLEKSRLSQKLLGFINQTAAARTETLNDDSEFWSRHVSSMSIFETFIQRLTVASKEGKVMVEWPLNPSTGSNNATLRFTQIHSASQFGDVLQEAHAIVLAGGTLRPFTHVAAELFGDDADVTSASYNAEVELARDYDLLPSGSHQPSLDSTRIPSSLVQRTPRLTTFTCGHVIPPSNVQLSCLSSGPTHQKLDFRHSTRSSSEIIDELGRTILTLCSVVPKGFVVFLPSYNYERTIFMRWRAKGILNEIERKKSIHREPKNSRDLEAALARYSDEASCNNFGAILFAVMGGKMSEGINFADDRARCVLIVGLPYPDITDPILREKMQSLDKEATNAGSAITGQVYYQNLCMRTVNQSIGRAIRHANDYAAIVLADFRYATDTRIWRGLPQWLRKGCVAPDHGAVLFGNVRSDIQIFFANISSEK